MTTTSSTTSSSSASSGVLTSLGVGSGLDINSLVESLTTAEMSGPNARVTREQTAVTAQVSAIATLKSSLSTFQSSLTSLLSGSGFSSRSVSSADTAVLTATATSSAALGNYNVQVSQLAQSQQLLSTNFTGGSTAIVGTGTLSFTSGTSNFSVTIDSTNNTLAGIRDAINSASDNKSVSATLVYGQTGAQLVLTSLKSGATAGMTVTASGGDGGLDQLTYDTGNTTHYTEKQPAQDAIVFVSGVEHHSATNQVSDAIDGVTLNLVSAKPNTDIALTIGNDPATVTKQVQAFVDAYNKMQTAIASLDSYDSSTQDKGPLFGDAMYTSLKNQIHHALTDAVSTAAGNYNSLASLGILTGVDGQMTLDSTKLSAALSSDFKTVSNVFSGSKGVLARVNKQITSALLTGGSVSSRSASLKTRQTNIDNDKDTISMRTAKLKERYLAKFNAMDSLLAKLNNTSSYLTEQFKALNKSSS